MVSCHCSVSVSDLKKYISFYFICDYFALIAFPADNLYIRVDIQGSHLCYWKLSYIDAPLVIFAYYANSLWLRWIRERLLTPGRFPYQSLAHAPIDITWNGAAGSNCKCSCFCFWYRCIWYDVLPIKNVLWYDRHKIDADVSFPYHIKVLKAISTI